MKSRRLSKIEVGGGNNGAVIETTIFLSAATHAVTIGAGGAVIAGRQGVEGSGTNIGANKIGCTGGGGGTGYPRPGRSGGR